MTPAIESIYLSESSIAKKLERARDELLDLSARNRLLNMPRQSRASRIIEVVDEKSPEVYRLLVTEGRTMTFLPGRGNTAQSDDAETDEIKELAQPEDDSRDDRGVLRRHADTRLQTRLTAVGLQKRLLELYLDARTLEDEQGVNILYLALGTLRWVDAHNKEVERYAPLVLVPVSLERASAQERFRLKWRQEDCSSNLSLEAFLDRIHLLKLPAFAAGDDFDYPTYVSQVADVVAAKDGWSVQPDDIVVGFFSFAKFLMYRDLDPANWPAEAQLTERTLIRTLLESGFAEETERISDEAHLDESIGPADMRHIYDSDSSQVLAAFEARKGASLVIQGPPGTGKSQTIANIIGEAVADGKTVLFVAEKMAALEVVKRRLDLAGIGDACLELHSNKANRKALLAEVRRIWELGAPRGASADVADSGLIRTRHALNGHAFLMHRMLPSNGLTPYEVIGQLARIQRLHGTGIGIQVEGSHQWNAEDRHERFRIVREIARWIEAEETPARHTWWCVDLESILPIEAERISRTAAGLSAGLTEIAALQAELARELDMGIPEKLRDFAAIATRAQKISTAPVSVGAALASTDWERTEDVRTLIEIGKRFTTLNSELQSRISSKGWRTSTKAARAILESLSGDLDTQWLARVRRLDQLIPQLIEAANSVRTSIGLADHSESVAAVRQMLEMARHVAAAPPAAPEIFTAAAWDHGVEQAIDLVNAIACLETAQQEIRDRLSDSVWELDCGALRQILARHGSGPLRWLSTRWRQADRTIKSVLRSPATPLTEVVRLLDEAMKGQKARLLIRQSDAFGSSAFGQQWRGERSTAAPLRAIAEWARSLGTSSREVRALTAKVHDSTQVRVDVSCLDAIWTEFEALLSTVSPGFNKALLADRGQICLKDLGRWAGEIVAASSICDEVFTNVPKLVSDQVHLLNDLNTWQVTEQALSGHFTLGASCFGGLWNSNESDWTALEQAFNWVHLNGDIRHVAARFERPQAAAVRGDRISGDIESLVAGMARLFQDLRLATSRLFNSNDARDIGIVELKSRLDLWAAGREELSKWVAYSGRVKRARSLGTGEIIDRLESGALAPQRALPELERAYYTSVLMSIAQENPELVRFDGEIHQGYVDEFATLEEEHRFAARIGAMRAHHKRIPHGGLGPVGVLKAEIARRRGHMPIRQLMSHAGAAIQALKPVFMMSPLSVAQFLAPGELQFDVLVMDEASQIQPVDALGAIARCRQAIVVGDERQLPPTRFFARMTGGQADEDDSETAQVADVESILGLFLARGAPQRTLQWHYRSEHHSLIALSNREFYNSKLFIIPSPWTSAAGRGIRFHHIPEGIYDSGNTRTNPMEAKRVAEAVMEHARVHPGQTLGVGTFSVAQRRAILDQLELLRRAQPQAESFFSSHPHEPFFVKNLENIQGDERDVIFISVGYGKNSAGQMSMRFGPLSSQGGERRLNVLITRARRRCEVFSSITDRDIDSERASGAGVAAFQLFLRYARTGQLDAADARSEDGGASSIEEEIANALRARGYEVDTRVGMSGAFVDVAVLDPDRRDRYVIGIECDGLSYASARSARDRDRLRREALGRQGWKLHRIWSMDWFQRPIEQLDRAISAIEAEKQRLAEDAEEEKGRFASAPIEREDNEDVFEDNQAGAATYTEACPVKPLPDRDLLDTSTQAIATMVKEIVEVEGPIHQDEVVVRVRSVWGLQRAGTRIQDHVAKAIRAARMWGDIEREGKFLNVPGRAAHLRNRSSVASRSLRLPEMLPPAEIRAGIEDVIRENFGAREEEIASTVLRRLGYATTSANLRDVVQTAIRKMRASGVLAEHGDLLILAESAPVNHGDLTR